MSNLTQVWCSTSEDYVGSRASNKSLTSKPGFQNAISSLKFITPKLMSAIVMFSMEYWAQRKMQPLSQVICPVWAGIFWVDTGNTTKQTHANKNVSVQKVERWRWTLCVLFVLLAHQQLLLFMASCSMRGLMGSGCILSVLLGLSAAAKIAHTINQPYILVCIQKSIATGAVSTQRPLWDFAMQLPGTAAAHTAYSLQLQCHDHPFQRKADCWATNTKV